MLTQQQKQHYEREGYVVVEGFKSAAEMAAVRERAHEIVAAFDPGEARSIFTTREQALATDHYFLESAEQIRCFFEEEAFAADGSLRQAKELSINKIGHALHDLDPVFDGFSRGPELAALAADLGLEQPLLWQSMYIFKQPGIGGEVAWHQDATFLHTDPISVTTFWFALEDAHVENGCLWVEPGGHRSPLRELFVREGDRVSMQRLDTTPWPGCHTCTCIAGARRQPGLLPRAAAALQRAEPIEPITSRLFAARHRRTYTLCRQQLAAAQFRDIAIARVLLTCHRVGNPLHLRA